MTWTRGLAWLCVGLTLLASCSAEKQSDKSGVRYRVAVIPKGTNHVFWKAVEKGARRADAELPDLEIVWKGPPGEGDANAQIGVVETFIAERFSGICLAPLDARALEKPVRAAALEKIPVVIFDSGLASADAPIESFVATDNYKGGQSAGHALAKLLGGRGAIIAMPYLVGSESTEQREKGFLDAIKKYADITILSADLHGGPDEGKATSVAENLLATYGDRVQGIFCSNESNASGMLNALRRDSRGLAKKVKFIGFDSSDNLVKGLSDGIVHGLILQDPVKMGYESVKAMHKKLTGGKIEKRIETGETIATPENQNEPAIKALLNPLGAP